MKTYKINDKFIVKAENEYELVNVLKHLKGKDSIKDARSLIKGDWFISNYENYTGQYITFSKLYKVIDDKFQRRNGFSESIEVEVYYVDTWRNPGKIQKRGTEAMGAGYLRDITVFGSVNEAMDFLKRKQKLFKRDSINDDWVKGPRGQFQLSEKSKKELEAEGYGWHHTFEANGETYHVMVKNNSAIACKDSMNAYGGSKFTRRASSYIRSMCIKHDWYTAGDNEAYFNMFDKADSGKWTVNEVALDIAKHSHGVTAKEVADELLKLNKEYDGYLLDSNE